MILSTDPWNPCESAAGLLALASEHCFVDFIGAPLSSSAKYFHVSCNDADLFEAVYGEGLDDVEVRADNDEGTSAGVDAVEEVGGGESAGTWKCEQVPAWGPKQMVQQKWMMLVVH